MPASRRASPTWKAWWSIIARCTYAASSRSNYVGIAICDRWRSFDAFLADMGERPSPKHSIDRINNALGYEPSNCRWATPAEQSQNRTSTVLTLDLARAALARFKDGEKVSAIARSMSVGYHVVWDAVHGRSWPQLQAA